MDENGRRIGHYTIVEKIGEGGMGEVFAARDTRLDRTVAIKILTAFQGASEERIRRFEQEALATASLNHPNIVTIHELYRDGETLCLVMELVEGDTLREKLDRDLPTASPTSSTSGRTIPVRKAIDYAVQICRGLAAAHGRGVTHRDLKPENILVTPDGQAKILDFGLAKVTLSDPESSKTRALSEPGTVLGTVGYMSPEQVRGLEVGPRSDIFSLGVVLYEMLAGRRAFTADSSVEVMNAILTEEPSPLADSGARVPAAIVRILERCLEKEPAERFESCTDLAFALEAVRDSTSSGSVVGLEGVEVARRRGGPPAVVAAVAVILAFVVGSFFPFSGSSVPESEPAPALVRLTFDAGEEFQPSIAPDGQSFVFVAPKGEADNDDVDIFFQRVGGENVLNLTADCVLEDAHPAISPDGNRIAFRSEREGGGIFIMGATGESIRRLTDFGFNPAWSPDGRSLVIGTERIDSPTGRQSISELWRVDVADGSTVRIETPDAVEASWSPDGERLFYWGLPSGTGQRVLQTVPAAGGEPLALTNDSHMNWNPVCSADGRSLYFSSDRGGVMNLWRMPIDPKTGAAAGEPRPLTLSTMACEWIGVSEAGTRIVFSASSTTMAIERASFDLETEESGEFEALLDGGRTVFDVSPSPDGQWICFSTRDRWEDLYVARSDGSSLLRLTNDAHRDRGANWTSDSKSIFFYSNRNGRYDIWKIDRDGSGLAQVTQSSRGRTHGASPAPDGRRMAVHLDAAWHVMDIDRPWPIELGEERAAAASRPERERQRFLAWSPDGESALIARPDSDGPAVLHHEFATETTTKLFDGFARAEWLPDGRRILAQKGGRLFIVDVETLEQRTIAEYPEGLSVSIDPQGSFLYAIRRKTETDIWMLSLEGAPDEGEAP